MFTLENYLTVKLKWTRYAIAQAFEKYADLTQDGETKSEAFRRCFGVYGVPDSYVEDGYLSQYYCGPDRDYDID